MYTGALLIAGDFNLHWTIPTKTDVCIFLSILESMDLPEENMKYGSNQD